MTLEASNEISAFLATQYMDIFQTWNDVAEEAKAFFQKHIIPQIPHLDSFDNALLHQCLEWDIVHYLIEDFYSNTLKKPLSFDKVIHVYEPGHMPCGWEGIWPNGKLVIY